MIFMRRYVCVCVISHLYGIYEPCSVKMPHTHTQMGMDMDIIFRLLFINGISVIEIYTFSFQSNFVVNAHVCSLSS